MESALTQRPGRLVSVVLVTWNSAEYLPRCLDGIARQTWPDLEIIAVDNASSDGSDAALEAFERFTSAPGSAAEDDDPLRDRGAPAPPPAPSRPAIRLTLIRNPANAGFARAVNQAIALARGEFVQLVNPDAWFEPGYIERLVAAFDAAGEEFAAATGTLIRGEGCAIRPTGIVDSKGIRMTRSGRHLDIGQGRPDGVDERGLVALECAVGSAQWAGESRLPRDHRAPSTAHCALPTAHCREVFGVSGAAAMYRRSFIDDATIDGQFFDEDFFSYREDADVAWRGRLLGWRALHAGDAVAVHVRSVTPERRRDLTAAVNMHSVKNRFLLRLKNEGLYLALRNALFEIPRDVVAIVAVLTIERTSLPGLRWIWRNRGRVLAHRREIQKRRRTSDRALARWFR